MIERREYLRFASESRQPFRVPRERLGQHLERDVAIELGIPGTEYSSHSAFAKQCGDLIDAEVSAESKCQRGVDYMALVPLSNESYQRRARVRRDDSSRCGRVLTGWPMALNNLILRNPV